jgi:hypothetical protein
LLRLLESDDTYERNLIRSRAEPSSRQLYLASSTFGLQLIISLVILFRRNQASPSP